MQIERSIISYIKVYMEIRYEFKTKALMINNIYQWLIIAFADNTDFFTNRKYYENVISYELV